MSVIYGYARCSTTESRQDISRQKQELKALGVTEDKHVFWEYESGAKKEHVEFQKLLDSILPGDSIATTEVSRLTRSTRHLCDILQFVQSKKIRLIIGSFIVDCREEMIDPMTKGMLMMWGVFAEMERDIISQRVKSGMANAKAKGSLIGRPKVSPDQFPDRFWKYYSMYQEKQITITDFAKIMNRSRSTIYNYIRIAKGGNKKC